MSPPWGEPYRPALALGAPIIACIVEEEAREMCRSIKTLRDFETRPADEDVRAAALQFVRKVSGYRTPSARNQAAFDTAVAEISDATRRMLDTLEPPRRRERVPVTTG
jgi:hypothetical protein